jgi:hypothetical protein
MLICVNKLRAISSGVAQRAAQPCARVHHIVGGGSKHSAACQVQNGAPQRRRTRRIAGGNAQETGNFDEEKKSSDHCCRTAAGPMTSPPAGLPHRCTASKPALGLRSAAARSNPSQNVNKKCHVNILPSVAPLPASKHIMLGGSHQQQVEGDEPKHCQALQAHCSSHALPQHGGPLGVSFQPLAEHMMQC